LALPKHCWRLSSPPVLPSVPLELWKHPHPAELAWSLCRMLYQGCIARLIPLWQTIARVQLLFCFRRPPHRSVRRVHSHVLPSSILLAVISRICICRRRISCCLLHSSNIHCDLSDRRETWCGDADVEHDLVPDAGRYCVPRRIFCASIEGQIG